MWTSCQEQLSSLQLLTLLTRVDEVKNLISLGWIRLREQKIQKNLEKPGNFREKRKEPSWWHHQNSHLVFGLWTVVSTVDFQESGMLHLWYLVPLPSKKMHHEWYGWTEIPPYLPWAPEERDSRILRCAWRSFNGICSQELLWGSKEIKTKQRQKPNWDTVATVAFANHSGSSKAGKPFRGVCHWSKGARSLYCPRATSHWMWAVPGKGAPISRGQFPERNAVLSYQRPTLPIS